MEGFHATCYLFAVHLLICDLLNGEAGKSVYIKKGDECEQLVEGVYVRLDDDTDGNLHAKAQLVFRMESRNEGGTKNAVWGGVVGPQPLHVLG